MLFFELCKFLGKKMHFRGDFCPKVHFSDNLKSVTLPFCRGMGGDALAELRNAGAVWLTENKRITRNPQFRIPQAANHRAREEKSAEM